MSYDRFIRGPVTKKTYRIRKRFGGAGWYLYVRGGVVELRSLKDARRWIADDERQRYGRDVEGVGHHGYAPSRPETHAERLRRLAERRRRYRQLAQSPGEQGPGYDPRRPRRRRRRR